jgi:RNA polymerase sigma-70 factor (ECF subfamily)
MKPAYLRNRLNQISTLWEQIRRAHSGPTGVQAAAQQALLERYQGAVYRYLLTALNQDADAADDLFLEFALRFVRGDFHRADPSRGRFRDLVKSALINLMINYRKQRARDRKFGGHGLDEADCQLATEGLGDGFLLQWRKELLDRAWDALAACQAEDEPPYYLVLRLRCEHPEITSEDLAVLLTRQLRPAQPFNDAGVRKTLQRSRERFGELLLDEVARSIQTDAPDAVEAELAELGFLVYCRRALAVHRGVRQGRIGARDGCHNQ